MDAKTGGISPDGLEINLIHKTFDMEQSKKKKDYSNQSKTTGQVQNSSVEMVAAGEGTGNMENNPLPELSDAEILYDGINIALHGKVKNGVTNRLCDWTMPPCIKEPRCEKPKICTIVQVD